MTDFKVSIMVPIHNVERYLAQCLNSILGQTYSNIEYVLIDDCSTDNSMAVLQQTVANSSRKDSCKILKNENNLGIAATRRILIEHATGDYVLFVDSDDWIEPDMVKKLATKAQAEDLDIVGCDFYKDFVDGKQTVHTEDYSLNCRENMMKAINYTGIGTILWKLLIRRSLFDNFPFPDMDISEDYPATIKLYYYAHKMGFIHEPLYHYVQYNNARYSFQVMKSVTNHVKAVQNVELFFRENHIYEETHKQLTLRKFIIKKYYLLEEYYSPQLWKTIFPEANKAWREIKGFSRKERIIYWLAEKNILLPITILYAIKRLFKGKS